MTLKVIQICNKCKKERPLEPVASGNGQATINHQVGGWRPFADKHVCPDCINTFIEELG